MATYGEGNVWIHVFLTLALVGGEWSTSLLPFYFKIKRPWYPLYRSWGGRGGKTGFDNIKKKRSLLYRDSNSYPSVLQPVAIHNTDCCILTPVGKHETYRLCPTHFGDISWFSWKLNSSYTVFLFHSFKFLQSTSVQLAHRLLQNTIVVEIDSKKFPPVWIYKHIYGLILLLLLLLLMTVQPSVGPWLPFQFLNPIHSQ
jgi:hypothetical protein